MKKGLSLLLSIIMLAGLIIPFCAYAAEKTVTVNDMVFSVDGKKATLIKYNGNGGSVEVPDTVSKATVTEIGNQAFA